MISSVPVLWRYGESSARGEMLSETVERLREAAASLALDCKFDGHALESPPPVNTQLEGLVSIGGRLAGEAWHLNQHILPMDFLSGSVVAPSRASHDQIRNRNAILSKIALAPHTVILKIGVAFQGPQWLIYWTLKNQSPALRKALRNRAQRRPTKRLWEAFPELSETMGDIELDPKRSKRFLQDTDQALVKSVGSGRLQAYLQEIGLPMKRFLE